MNFVFATVDIGNANSLKAIAQKAREQGHNVSESYGEGKVFADDALVRVRESLVGADWFVVSLSSSAAKAEVEGNLIKHAKGCGAKVLVLSDIDGMLYRSRWCPEATMLADIATVVSENEVEWARQFVGPETRIVPVVNPSWISFFEVKKGREEVRATLGIKDDETLVVLPGDKEVERMVIRLHALIEATRLGWRKFHFLVTAHGGADHTPKQLERLAGYSNFPITFSLERETGVSTLDAIGAADLVITGPGTSTAYMAACQRKPLICFNDRVVDSRYWEQLSGQTSWSLVQAGASSKATRPETLEHHLSWLLNNDSELRNGQLEAQRTLFARSKFEGAADEVLKLLG